MSLCQSQLLPESGTGHILLAAYSVNTDDRMKNKLLVIGVILVGVIVVGSATKSARRFPRNMTKEMLTNVHEGVGDYFEESWPTTHKWYNWWYGD